MSDNMSGPAVVVVLWHIKKGKEQEFLDHWTSESMRPGPNSGLLFEILSKAPDPEQYSKGITLGSFSCTDEVTRYVNVGVWPQERDFWNHPPVKNAAANPQPKPYEHTLRQRTVLRPAAAQFETEDLEGFLAAAPVTDVLFIRNHDDGGLITRTKGKTPYR